MTSSYVPNQTTMGLLFIGVLIFAVATGFQGWPFYWPIFLYAGYWAVYLKLMPDEDRSILKSARGVIVGLFVGRAVAVIAAWGLGASLRSFI